MFWIVATYARCLQILAVDAPAVHADFAPGFTELVAALGIASPADLGRQAQDVLGYLPRLRHLTDAILAADPETQD
jgi:hypothetical protein